jgi:hypothetical protein
MRRRGIRYQYESVWEYTVILGYIDFILVFQNAEKPNPSHFIQLEQTPLLDIMSIGMYENSLYLCTAGLHL